MPIEQALDHSACDREPIHIPSSIQSHGMLLVVDQDTDLILQAAGFAGSLLQFRDPVVGDTAQKVLGTSVENLVQRSGANLTWEPVYLGNVESTRDRPELTIVAHKMQGVVIVEMQPCVSHTSTPEILATIRSITERVGGIPDLVEACNLAANEVRRITGYDRVMIYRFLPDGTGSVVAEVKADHLSPFLNHRYPASDIPQQARELYRRSAIRLIPDVGYTPAPLAPVLCPTTQQPLDMSHSILRSVSPVHIRYLKNMGVGASMSVSLLQSGQLWGLIACHNTTAKFMSYQAQEVCRHIGQILSQKIRSCTELENYLTASELGAARDRVMRLLISADDPQALLAHLCPDLQAMVPSHGVAVSRNGTVAAAGHAPTEAQTRKLAAWLQNRATDVEDYATDCLLEEYPEAKAFTPEISGLLSIVLPGDEPVIIMWFRAEQLQEINWAGNPHEPLLGPDSSLGTLNPRKSFATWRETVRGRSRPWNTVEVDIVRGFIPRAAFVLQQKAVRDLNRLLSGVNEQLASLASKDALTGVANRREFDVRLATELQRANRSGTALALVTLDVDFFKQYNDHYGHGMGDDCLKQIAKVLQSGRRVADVVARTGGEEFALLLPDTDIGGAMAVGETLRSKIEGLRLPHAKSPMDHVTASFGVAHVRSDQNSSAEALTRAADKALYEAKRCGRNRVAACTENLTRVDEEAESPKLAP